MHNQIEVALSYIKSDDRMTWIKIGGALKTEIGESGFKIWDEWSQKSDKYNAKDCINQWKTLKAGKVNIGTLFYEAKQLGFEYKKSDFKQISKEEIQANEKRLMKEKLEAEKTRKIEVEQAKKSSMERWRNGKPINLNHPYLIKKNLTKAFFLKNILRQDEKNNIIVPIKYFGEMVGVQRITYTGDKFLEKNMQLENANLIIGSWDNAKKNGIYLAEGLATGASVHQATGQTVMIAFHGHNMTLLASQLKNNTNMKVYVLSDIDNAGINFSNQAKEILGERCTIFKPIFSNEDIENFMKNNDGKHPTDFNDLHKLKGEDFLKNQILNSKKIQNQNFFTESRKLFKENLHTQNIENNGLKI